MGEIRGSTEREELGSRRLRVTRSEGSGNSGGGGSQGSGVSHRSMELGVTKEVKFGVSQKRGTEGHQEATEDHRRAG